MTFTLNRLRNLVVSTSEDPEFPPNHVHDNARLTASEGPHVMEEKQDVGEPSSSQTINWNLETQDAPESKPFSLFFSVDSCSMLYILLGPRLIGYSDLFAKFASFPSE